MSWQVWFECSTHPACYVEAWVKETWLPSLATCSSQEKGPGDHESGNAPHQLQQTRELTLPRPRLQYVHYYNWERGLCTSPGQDSEGGPGEVSVSTKTAPPASLLQAVMGGLAKTVLESALGRGRSH